MTRETLGLGTAQAELDNLLDTVKRLEQRINRNTALNEVGNPVYGGPVRTYHAASFFTQGPLREDIASGFPVTFDLPVSVHILKIMEVVLRVKPVKIRNSATVAAAAPADTTGTSIAPSGGADTSGPSSAGSSGAGSHSHTISGTTAAGSSHLHNVFGSTDSQSTDPHSHGISINSASENTHTHGDGSLGSDNEAAHTHGIPHTHTTPNHTHPVHDHTVPGHGHALTLGITEGTTSAGIRVKIDGVDRSAVLGGPWSAQFAVNITPYLLDVRGNPSYGNHTMEFTVTTMGAIEIWLDWWIISKGTQ